MGRARRRDRLRGMLSRRIALALGLLTLGAACSEEPEVPGPAAGSGKEAEQSPAAAAAEVGGAGSTSPQVIRPQGPARRADFDSIAATIDPGFPGAPWPGEFLAEAAERLLLQVTRHLATGGDPGALRNVVTRDLSGSVPAEDGSRRALEGTELLGWLQGRLRVTRQGGAPVVAATVLQVAAPGSGGGDDPIGRTRVHLRVGTDPQGPAVERREQRDVFMEVSWRLGKRARISSVEVERATSRSLVPPFRDVTHTVLRGAASAGLSAGESLGLGALQAAGRTDALEPVAEILTGMHGVAVADLDGNGWDDLVVARAPGQPNQVWMNTGGAFREEAAARGLDWLEESGGVLICDLDGDGAQDVTMGVGPDVVVAWNDGSGVFTSRTTLPRAGEARVYSISAADVDLDGDLDLYDTRYFKAAGEGPAAPTPYHDAVNGAPNVFWRNRTADRGAPRPRVFEADTAAAGLDVENDRFSMVSVFDDFDGDGDLDLYVANDFGRNNLFLAERGRFRAAGPGPLTDKAAGMGLSLGDANLDGTRDLVVSNMFSAAGGRVTRDPRFLPGVPEAMRGEFMRHARGNSIFLGVEGGGFEDLTDMTGAAPGGWAWGSRFVDWNRDGLADIVVPNGFLSGRKGPDLESFFWRRVVGSTPLTPEADPARLDAYLGAWSVISQLSQFGRQDWNARERTFAYLNRENLEFEDVSLASGLGVPDDGRSLAVGDLDHDGRQDLVFRNRTAPTLRIFQGVDPGGHSASFRLRQGGQNPDGIGSLVSIQRWNGVPHSARIVAGDGFLGSSPAEAFFGLDERSAREVKTVEVRWPDGEAERFQASGGGALAGSSWLLVRGSGDARRRYAHGPATPGLNEEVAPVVRGGEAPPARSRVPMHAEFPLGAWRLPSFEGGTRRVDELCGEHGLALLFWSREVPGSERGLVGLEGGPLSTYALALDGVRESEAVREVAEALGRESRAGRAGSAERLILDLVLGRTLAPFEEMPLPLCFLLDGEGDLACIQVGSVDPALLREDAARLAGRSDPSDTTCLTGGRWIRGTPRRDLSGLYDGLRARGFNEFVDHLEARAPR